MTGFPSDETRRSNQAGLKARRYVPQHGGAASNQHGRPVAAHAQSGDHLVRVIGLATLTATLVALAALLWS